MSVNTSFVKMPNHWISCIVNKHYKTCLAKDFKLLSQIFSWWEIIYYFLKIRLGDVRSWKYIEIDLKEWQKSKIIHWSIVDVIINRAKHWHIHISSMHLINSFLITATNNSRSFSSILCYQVYYTIDKFWILITFDINLDYLFLGQGLEYLF